MEAAARKPAGIASAVTEEYYSISARFKNDLVPIYPDKWDIRSFR